jgi:uncharacterized protein
VNKFFVLTALFCAFAPPIAASQEITTEKVDYRIPGTELTLRGEVRIPKVDGPKSTVLILHSAGGIDGTGVQYARALNKRGIATMEIDFSRNLQWYPNAGISKFAILFLSKQYGLDPDRFGSMGFSSGGMVSLVNATEKFMQNAVQGNPVRFRAHAALYPLCALMYDSSQSEVQLKDGRIPTNGPPNFWRDMFKTMTGAPILLLAGADDDYEDASVECPKLQALINSEKPNLVKLTVYEGAGHGWDVPVNRSYRDGYSRKNENIRHFRSEATFEKSVKVVVDFFEQELQK